MKTRFPILATVATVFLVLLHGTAALAQAAPPPVPLPLGTDPAPAGSAFTGCNFYEVIGGVAVTPPVATTAAALLTTGPRVVVNASAGTHSYLARFFTTVVLPAPSTPLVVESADSNVFTVTIPVTGAAPVSLRKVP